MGGGVPGAGGGDVGPASSKDVADASTSGRTLGGSCFQVLLLPLVVEVTVGSLDSASDDLLLSDGVTPSLQSLPSPARGWAEALSQLGSLLLSVVS